MRDELITITRMLTKQKPVVAADLPAPTSSQDGGTFEAVDK